MMNLSSHWQRVCAYFDAQGDGWPYSVFRFLWVPYHVAFAWYIVDVRLHEQGLPALPYHSSLAVFSVMPLWLLLSIAGVHVLCAACSLMGFKTRVAQAVMVGTAVMLFFHSVSTYQNHYAFYLFITAFLAFASTERYYSLDARQKRRQLHAEHFAAWQQQPVALLPQRLIVLQLSVLYLFAGLNKLEPGWFTRWSTTPELIDLTERAWVEVAWQALLDWQLAWLPLSLLIGCLLLLSVGVHFASRYPLIVVAGIAMHLMMETVLPVIIFTPMCITILLLAVFPVKNSESN